MVKRIPLDNVCAKKIPTLSSQYDGLIDYVDISSVDNAEKRIVSMQCVSAKEAPSRAKQLLEVGDILVSTVRPNLNAVAMVEQQTDNLLVGSTGYCVLRCNDSIDKRYVFHFCQSPYFIDDMTSQATGASYPAVSSGIVKSSTIPDYPIEKQKLIADCLDKVSELIALRKEQLAKLDQLVKSRFIELFGDPVADSMHWGQVPLSHYLKSIRYGTSTPPSFSETGYEFIRATNIKNGKIVSSDMKFISEEEAQKIEKCKVLGGEMIIVRSGVNAGDTCIITAEHRGQYAGYDMILVFAEELHPVFANVLINTEYMDRVVKPLTRRAAQPHLNSEQVQSLPMIQVPYEQQKEFATFVEQTDKSKLAIQQSLDKLELLKKSLMQEYFG